MPVRSYDLIVVGGGPAGMYSALQATKGGLNVLLVDQNHDVGIPVQCGEACSYDTLEQGGLSRNAEYVVNDIKNLVLVFPNKISFSSNVQGCVLDRTLMEQQIARELENLGVELSLSTRAYNYDPKNCEVSLRKKSKRETVRGKLVIGADGPNCLIGRQAGIVNEDEWKKSLIYGVGYRKLETDDLIYHDIDEMYFFLDRKNTRYYGWCFPLGHDLYNVGLLIDRSSQKKNLHEFLKSIEIHTIDSYETRIGGVISANGPYERISGNRVLLTGDAGGLTFPHFFSGIKPAIISGKIAGDTAVRAIQSEDTSDQFLKAFDERCKSSADYELFLQAKSDFYENPVEKLNLMGKLVEGLEMENNLSRLKFLLRLLFKSAMSRDYRSIFRPMLRTSMGMKNSDQSW